MTSNVPSAWTISTIAWP